MEKSKSLFTCSKLCFASNFCLKIGLHIPNFKQKRFWSIVKTFRERCHNYIPRVHQILLKNNVSRIFYQFLPFGLSALTFWMFGDIFLVGLSKLPFMGLEDTFGCKKFEWKLHNLLVHKRRFLGEISVWNLRFTSTHSRRWKMRVFSEELFGRVVKIESFVSGRYYRRKKFSKMFIIIFFFGLSAKFSRMLGWKVFGWKKFSSISDFELMTFRLRLQRKLLAEKIFLRIENFPHQFPTFS